MTPLVTTSEPVRATREQASTLRAMLLALYQDGLSQGFVEINDQGSHELLLCGGAPDMRIVFVPTAQAIMLEPDRKRSKALHVYPWGIQNVTQRNVEQWTPLAASLAASVIAQVSRSYPVPPSHMVFGFVHDGRIVAVAYTDQHLLEKSRWILSQSLYTTDADPMGLRRIHGERAWMTRFRQLILEGLVVPVSDRLNDPATGTYYCGDGYLTWLVFRGNTGQEPQFTRSRLYNWHIQAGTFVGAYESTPFDRPTTKFFNFNEPTIAGP